MKRNACFNLVLWQKVIHFIFLVIEASNVQQPKLQSESEQNLTDSPGEKCHLLDCSIPEAFDLCKLT